MAAHRHEGSGGSVDGLAEPLEPVLEEERDGAGPGQRPQRAGAEPGQDVRDERTGQPEAAQVGAGAGAVDHSDAVVAADDAQTRDRHVAVRHPQVLGARVDVALVELAVGEPGLRDEDVDAQPGQPVRLDGGQLGPARATHLRRHPEHLTHEDTFSQVNMPRQRLARTDRRRVPGRGPAGTGTLPPGVAGVRGHRSDAGPRRMLMELMQYRRSVGVSNPSPSKTCPRWEPQFAQRTSVRVMPREVSERYSTRSCASGAKNDGHPQWLSNFSVLRNNSLPQARHA